MIPPVLSIIVPNYNHCNFLEARFQSILNQSFKNYEVIILDDFSIDNSKEIIEKYRILFNNCRVLYNDHNSGSPFMQWDKGIREAKGEFVWIAESDDWCENSFIETILGKMITEPNIVLGYVQSIVIQDNKINWISCHSCLEEIINGEQFIRKYLVNGNSIFNASMAIFRRSVYERIEPKHVELKFCGDWLFWANISALGDVLISGKLLNYFRKHDCDVSHTAYLNGINHLEGLKILFSFKDKCYISEFEFELALKKKYLDYLNSKAKLNKQVRTEIEFLFFNDIHCRYFNLTLQLFKIKFYLERFFRSVLMKVVSWL
jgi:glycosyltransferase involved in cell wall biosynthesis